jgi:hypothetical protein
MISLNKNVKIFLCACNASISGNLSPTRHNSCKNLSIISGILSYCWQCLYLCDRVWLNQSNPTNSRQNQSNRTNGQRMTEVSVFHNQMQKLWYRVEHFLLPTRGISVLEIIDAIPRILSRHSGTDFDSFLADCNNFLAEWLAPDWDRQINILWLSGPKRCISFSSRWHTSADSLCRHVEGA